MKKKKLSSIKFSSVEWQTNRYALTGALNQEMESLCRKYRDVRFVDVKIIYDPSNFQAYNAIIIYQVVKE